LIFDQRNKDLRNEYLRKAGAKNEKELEELIIKDAIESAKKRY